MRQSSTSKARLVAGSTLVAHWNFPLGEILPQSRCRRPPGSNLNGKTHLAPDTDEQAVKKKLINLREIVAASKSSTLQPFTEFISSLLPL